MEHYSNPPDYWSPLSKDTVLYRFDNPEAAHELPIGHPILMLHGTLGSHRAWHTLAEYLKREGAPDIYALDIPEIRDNQNLEIGHNYVAAAVDTIKDVHPEARGIVMIGFGAGGLLAYRYWQQLFDKSKISTIIMLATPHRSSVFQGLNEASIGARRPEENVRRQTSMLDFNRISTLRDQGSTMLVNLYGNGSGHNYDGVVRGMPLPETINWTFPVRHADIKKDEKVAKFILKCLRGERYQIQLKLVGMQMRRADYGDLAGPIAFEIEGIVTPPDTVFQPVSDRMYLFDDSVPPICTLSCPVKQTSATVGIHLRDLSHTSGRRRRMYIRLHIPLVDGDSTAHTMQDSEGSDFLWKIIVKRLPTVLGPAWYQEYVDQISRGI